MMHVEAVFLTVRVIHIYVLVLYKRETVRYLIDTDSESGDDASWHDSLATAGWTDCRLRTDCKTDSQLVRPNHELMTLTESTIDWLSRYHRAVASESNRSPQA